MSKQNSKKNNGFKTLLLLMGLGALIGCTKPEDPQPQPAPTNDSTIVTPPESVKPYDTMYLRWKVYPDWTPYEDSVRNRLKPGVIQLTIHVYGENGIGCPINATNWSPSSFSKVRHGAQQIINVDSTRTKLDGLVDVNKIGPAGYEPTDEEDGTISWFDADYFRIHGLNIVPNSKQY